MFYFHHKYDLDKAIELFAEINFRYYAKPSWSGNQFAAAIRPEDETLIDDCRADLQKQGIVFFQPSRDS